MASGQPSGVPLPSRKTAASGPTRTRRKNVRPPPPLAGRRAQYLLMCFGTFYVCLEMKFSGRGEYFSQITIKQRRESSSHFTGGALNFAVLQRPNYKKENLYVCATACVCFYCAAATVRTLNFVYDETLLKCASAPLLICSADIVVRLWPAEVMHI
jgi:hypothetical protein